MGGGADMTPADFEDEGVRVAQSAEVTLFRQRLQLIHDEQSLPPEERHQRFLARVDRMFRLMRLGKFTGFIAIHLVQGGIKKIETEQEMK